MSLHKIKKSAFKGLREVCLQESLCPFAQKSQYQLQPVKRSKISGVSWPADSLSLLPRIIFSPLEYKFWTISLSSCTSVTDDLSLNYFRNAFMESVVWDIEAPSFLNYILSNTINTTQSLEDWLCKREKPSTSQARHCGASALGFVSLSRASCKWRTALLKY